MRKLLPGRSEELAAVETGVSVREAAVSAAEQAL
jgi:hypothetical protein